jgi:demethylmenaquinone methyltransferase / 2-methoxy-6-polyprenyl-1,4-benzoquinol methylase
MHDSGAPHRPADMRGGGSEHSAHSGADAASGSTRAPIPILGGYWSDESGRKRFVKALFDRSAAEYDDVERIAGLGTGAWYRGYVLERHGIKAGMKVLDVAAWTGLTARAAAKLTGDAGNVVALDPSAEMLREARKTPGMALAQATGEHLPCRTSEFDFLTMGYALRHLSDLHVAFGEFLRVLKPGGTVCLLEVNRPQSRLVAALLGLHIKTIVPCAARLFSRGVQPELLMRFWWDTIEACVPPSTIMEALAEAGFERIERFSRWGILSEYVARKPAAAS